MGAHPQASVAVPGDLGDGVVRKTLVRRDGNEASVLEPERESAAVGPHPQAALGIEVENADDVAQKSAVAVEAFPVLGPAPEEAVAAGAHPEGSVRFAGERLDGRPFASVVDGFKLVVR